MFHKEEHYDYVIIGAGIAGLYSAYLLSKKYPGSTFIILEKSQRIGGRMLVHRFHGIDVTMGAGVCRADKDKTFISLLKEMKIELHKSTKNAKYAPGVKANYKDYAELFSMKNRKSIVSATFAEYGKKTIGEKRYSDFVKAAGYSDYENADFNDVLNLYGMEDNIKPLNIYYVPWKVFTQRLVESIGKGNIKLGCQVVDIKSSVNGGSGVNGGGVVRHVVKCKDGCSYICEKVICATTIEPLRRLFPACEVYKEIAGQPFLRVYAKFHEKSKELLQNHIKGSIVVATNLQKIFTINEKQNIYMICYSDNIRAMELYAILKSKDKNAKCKYLERLVCESLGIRDTECSMVHIEDIMYHYWKTGTHYNVPLDTNKYKNRDEFIYAAQHPAKNIFVVGEVVAKYQGWCEGALLSVQNII